MYRIINNILFLLISSLILLSCKTYKNNILFRTEGNLYVVDSIRKENEKQKDMNYVVHKNDYIQYRVFTQNGEKLIDPDGELGRNGSGVIGQNQNMTGNYANRYLVRDNGKVYLPMVGDVYVDGLTLRLLDSTLTSEYNKFYVGTYVRSEVVNRRVIVFTPSNSAVVPIENENMNLIEVLAVSGAVSDKAKAHRIKVIRGDLKDPDVQIVDLTTIEGMKKAQLNIEPNDIVYVEPVKKIVPQTIQDITPILSLITTVITFVVLIATLNKN